MTDLYGEALTKTEHKELYDLRKREPLVQEVIAAFRRYDHTAENSDLMSIMRAARKLAKWQP